MRWPRRPHESPSPSRRPRTRCAAGRDLGAARLRGHRFVGVHGVVVAHARQHLRRVDGIAAVQCHDKGPGRRDPLQQIHAVADRTGRLGIGRHVGVPRGPGLALARQQASVGMQHHVVVLVGDGAEHLAFLRRRIGQQRQRLVAVAGEDHFVVVFLAVARDHLHAGRLAPDGAHGTVQPLAHRPALAHGVDIAARSALHHAPLRPAADPQHLVVGHELHQVARREFQDARGRRRPQRRGHRDQVVAAESLAVAVLRQVFAERGARLRRAQ